MPKEFVVHRFPANKEGKIDEYYILNLPNYNEPGFYRQSVSFNAFFNSLNRRNNDGKHLCVAELKDFWDKSVFGGRSKFCIPEFVKTFDSIWDFYKHIDFDYKKKKYGCMV